MSTKPAYLTATLAKGLDVLEALSDEEDAGLSDLARKIGVSSPTLFRLLATLAACGYVQKSHSNRYRLTLKAWELGAKAVRRIGLREQARPFMERLAAAIDETVHLSVLQGDGIVIIDKVDCANPVRVDTFVGLRAPLHCSATGKAILAHLDPLPAHRMLPPRLPRYTAATICDRMTLQRELARVQRRGWAQNREEWRAGVCAAAVPVRDAAFRVVAALSVTVPTSRFAEDVVRDRLVPALKASAEAISREVARRGR